MSCTVTLTFDLLTLKVVSESRVTCAASVPILVFLGLSVLDLSPMYATDRQTDRRQTEVRRAPSLNAPALGVGHNNRRKAAHCHQILPFFPPNSADISYFCAEQLSIYLYGK